MKKTVIFLIILLMTFGCEKLQHGLGETMSTDIMDFTLEDAQFAYYGDGSTPETFAKPMEEESSWFIAPKGYILISMTFTLKNNNKVNIKVGDAKDGLYHLLFKVNYGGKEYSINQYTKNPNNFSNELSLSGTAVKFNNAIFYINSDSSKVMFPEDELTVRMIGLLSFEPKNLTDSFTIIVNVPNSSGNNEYFAYTVN